MTATNTVREVNDANSVGTPIMGHKTTSPDVVSLGVPPVALHVPSDTVASARVTSALGSASNTSPLP